MNLLKKQRDAVGLSVYSDAYEFYTGEKGSERHHRMILNKLEDISPEIKSFILNKLTDLNLENNKQFLVS